MEDSPMFEPLSIQSKINGSYTVNFIEDLSGHLAVLSADEKLVFVIDEKVNELFSAELAVIEKNRRVVIASAEQHKNLDYAQKVIRKLIQQNIRKDDILVAIGGGITQDIVVFISSILYRGVQWKFYPTTLLAQCDSCIGSKSSINFDHFKNLLGTFNPPSEIFVYQGFLTTLSESEIRSGIGEMLHYFFTEGMELAEEVSSEFETLLTDRTQLNYFISNSLRIKKKIIEVDEFDTSIRHIFNYGHTFGHAIEAITDYAIPHGQAISIGMDLANYISLQKELLSQVSFDTMHRILVKNMPPFKITPDNIEQYCSALSRDKKNKGNKLGCILSRGAGNVEKFFIDIDDDLRKHFIDYSSTYGS
jgi:3-dehydroquinate synthase